MSREKNKFSGIVILALVLSVMSVDSMAISHYEGRKGDSTAIFEYIVAQANASNPRNSEAAIFILKDKSLLLGWSEFSGNGDDHDPGRIVGKISRDGGRTWGKKYTLIENDAKCNVMEVNFLRLKNGKIALFYGQKHTATTDCRIMMRTSADEGKTWTHSKQLSPSGKYTGLTNGRSLRLRSGRILLEVWEGGDVYCLLSDDDGKTWRDSQRVRPRNGDCFENVCIELKDGRVMMLMRTELGGQYKSISSDGGETWTSPVITQLKGAASPVFISRMPDSKNILAIWNHNPEHAHRNPLTSAISKDEGETWEHFKNIEDKPSRVAWAYPAITWIGNRALITYYEYRDRILSLKLKSIPSDWFNGE